MYEIMGLDPDIPPPGQEEQFGMYYSDDAREVYSRIVRVLTSGKGDAFETRLKDGKGVIKYIFINVSPNIDSSGKVIGLFGTYQDVTERKLAEEELNQFFNAKDIMFCIADINNFHFKKLNVAFEQILGYAQKEMLGKPFLDFVHPHDRKKTISIVEEKLSSGEKIIGFDNRYRCKDGSYKWLRWTSSPNTEMGVTYAIAFDITESKVAEEALKETEERFKIAMDAVKDGLFDWNTQTNEVYFSPGFFSMLGYGVDELPINMASFIGLLNPEDVEKNHNNIHQFFDGVGDGTAEFRLRAKTGEWIWVLARGKIVKFDDDGYPTRMIGTTTDITELKETENRLKMSISEKEILLKEIHHRVKNNMQVICSLLDLQSGYIEDKSAIVFLKETENRVRSMAMVHEKLYQSGDFSKIDFSDYTRTITEDISRMYYAESVSTEINISIKNIFLDVNTAIPCALIINELISNSFKHAFKDMKSSLIEIEFKQQKKGSYVLTVSDNGVGLPEKFDIAQCDSLGLQLVEALTNQLEGTIEIGSGNKGKGAKFTITFPSFV
ncbi:PAS domain S-box protein [Spirochaetota bacterium]